jgi:hypothetical protein
MTEGIVLVALCALLVLAAVTVLFVARADSEAMPAPPQGNVRDTLEERHEALTEKLDEAQAHLEEDHTGPEIADRAG